MRHTGASQRESQLPLRARLVVCLALSLAAIMCPPIAAAAPTVHVDGEAVPIPGFPHTGNVYGAGAAVKAEVTISGTEYAGAPYPLVGVNVYLPAGVKLHPQGFPTCPPQTVLVEREPSRCPKGSAAGPVGRVEGVVSFGGTRVKETAEVSSFFAPGGGFEFFTFGHSPTVLEVPSTAGLTHPGGGGGYGPEFVAPIPLVETVPGAPDASVESIDLTLGAAYRHHGKPVYYGTVPRTCPRGGFRVKAEFLFEAGNGVPVNVTVPFKAPCPLH
jgi:hypothetical protein